MGGTDLTILVALAAGVVSFLSPCVLPLVPAYLGQLTAVAVASSASVPSSSMYWHRFSLVPVAVKFRVAVSPDSTCR